MIMEIVDDWVVRAALLKRADIRALRVCHEENGMPWWHALPEEQLSRVYAYNSVFGWGLADKDFLRLPAPPPRPSGKHTAIVLVVYFRNVEETFRRWWQAIEWQLGRYCRLDRVRPDASHLTVLEGSHHPRRLMRWEVIDLGAHEGKAVSQVRSPLSSPHAGILAAMALHDKWTITMDGWCRAMFVHLAGYEARRRRGSNKIYVPSVFWQKPRLYLGLRPLDEAFSTTAVPCFVA